MTWSDPVARVNDAKLATFGGPVTFCGLRGTADPIVITAIRGTRDPLDGEQMAGMERIWARAGAFPPPAEPGALTSPQKGDVITFDLDPTEYVVFQVKPDEDPASDGLRLYLNRRRPNA